MLLGLCANQSDDNSSVTRGGVISVIYKTHWLGLSEPSWGREMDLQHSRNNILRYSAGTPDQKRQTNRFATECASVRHGASFLRTWANIFGAQPRSSHAHRVDSPPPRHSTPSGSPLLVQGRRWVVVPWEISASTTEGGVYLVRISVDPRLI